MKRQETPNPMAREADRSLIKRSPWLMIGLTLIVFFLLLTDAPIFMVWVALAVWAAGAVAIAVRVVQFKARYRESVWSVTD